MDEAERLLMTPAARRDAARLALWPELVKALDELADPSDCCPECGEWRNAPHGPDCKLMALLAKARELE